MQTARQNLLHHAAGVGKSLEAEFAVSFADAAVVDTAERQIMVEKMNIVVVDDSSACPRIVEDFIDIRAVFAVNVKRERFFV